MKDHIEYFLEKSNLDKLNYIIHYNFDQENLNSNQILNLSDYKYLTGIIKSKNNLPLIDVLNENLNIMSGYIYLDENLYLSFPHYEKNNLKELKAGLDFSMALYNNGNVISWGVVPNQDTDILEYKSLIDYGQASSTKVLTNISGISTYHLSRFALALSNDQKVTGWGFNLSGEATGGNNISNAIQISAGEDHGLALLSNKTIKGWGGNRYGQISDLNQYSNVKKVIAGYKTSFVIFENGTVTGLGLDNHKQITELSKINKPVKDISAGTNHIFALFEDGTVTGWGSNNLMQVGGIYSYKTEFGFIYHNNINNPHDLHFSGDWSKTIPASLSNIKQISAGDSHTLVLFNDGSITGWGNDEYNQISEKITSKNINQISAGFANSLFIKNNQDIDSAGNNDVNQTFGYVDYFASLEKIDNSEYTFIFNYEKTGTTDGVLLSTMYSGLENKIYGFNLIVNAYNNVCIEHYKDNDYILEETDYNLNTKGIFILRGSENNTILYYYNGALDDIESKGIALDLSKPYINSTIQLGNSINTKVNSNFNGFLKDFIYFNKNVNDVELKFIVDQLIYDTRKYYDINFLNESYELTDFPENSIPNLESFSDISTGCLDFKFFENSGETYGYLTGYLSGSENVVTGNLLSLYYLASDTPLQREITITRKTGEQVTTRDVTVSEITGSRNITGAEIYDFCNTQDLNLLIKTDLLRTYTTQEIVSTTDLFETITATITINSGEPYITGTNILTGIIKNANFIGRRFNPISNIVDGNFATIFHSPLIVFENGLISGSSSDPLILSFQEINNLKNCSQVYTKECRSNFGGVDYFNNKFITDSSGVIVTGFGYSDGNHLTGGKNLIGIKKIIPTKNAALAILSDDSITGWGQNTDGNINPTLSNETLYDYWTGDWTQTILSQFRVKDIIISNDTSTLAVLQDGTVTGWGKNNNGLLYGTNDEEIGFPFSLRITGVREDLSFLSGESLNYIGLYNGQPRYAYEFNTGINIYFDSNNSYWVFENKDLSIVTPITGSNALDANGWISINSFNSALKPSGGIIINNSSKNNLNGLYSTIDINNNKYSATKLETYLAYFDYIDKTLTGINDYKYQAISGLVNDEIIYYVLEKNNDNWVYYTSDNEEPKMTGFGGAYPWEADWDNPYFASDASTQTIFTIKKDIYNDNSWGIFLENTDDPAFITNTGLKIYSNPSTDENVIPTTGWFGANTDDISLYAYSYIISGSNNANFLINKRYDYSGLNSDYSDFISRPIYTGINNSYILYVEDSGNQITGWTIKNHNSSFTKINTSSASYIPEYDLFTEITIRPIYLDRNYAADSLNIVRNYIQLENIYENQAGVFNGDWYKTAVSQLSNVKKLAGSYRHIIALFEDGTITGWGNNDYNQISKTNPLNLHDGIWTGNWSDSPLSNLSGIKDVFVGVDTSFALFEDGSLTGWGKNIGYDPNYSENIWEGNWSNSVLNNVTGIKTIIGRTSGYNIVLFENGKLSGFGGRNVVSEITGLNNSTTLNEVYYNYDFSAINKQGYRNVIEKIENLEFRNDNIEPLKKYKFTKSSSFGFSKNHELTKRIDFINTLGVDEITINRYLSEKDLVEIYNFDLNSGLNINLNNLIYVSKTEKELFLEDNANKKLINYNGLAQTDGIDYANIDNTKIYPNKDLDQKDYLDLNYIKTGEAYFDYTGQLSGFLNIKDFVYLNGQKLISGYHYSFDGDAINYQTGLIAGTGVMLVFNSMINYDRYTGKGEYYYDLGKRFFNKTNLIWINGVKINPSDYLETSYNDVFYPPHFSNIPNNSIYNNQNTYFNL